MVSGKLLEVSQELLDINKQAVDDVRRLLITLPQTLLSCSNSGATCCSVGFLCVFVPSNMFVLSLNLRKAETSTCYEFKKNNPKTSYMKSGFKTKVKIITNPSTDHRDSFNFSSLSRRIPL